MRDGWNKLMAKGRIAAFCLSFWAGLVLLGSAGHAQLSNNPGQLLQQLQQQTGTPNSGISGAQPSAPADVTVQPASRSNFVSLPPSRLEQIMSARAGAKLTQFGYDALGQAREVTIPQAGEVQDDYILGPGDEIVVSFRGQENSEFRSTVSRTGQVLLPRLNPISAAGRTFGSFRGDVEAAVRRAYVATNAFVSVARLRQISVLISGEVNIPGTRIVPGLASVVDALVLSGGVKKTGSMRSVRIERGGKSYIVDLYSVLSNASSVAANMQLADGDRILVPALGRVVAVSGMVRQPGIYELPPGATSMKTQNLLALAGGTEVRGNYRFSILRVGANGNSQMVSVADENATIGDSEILFAQLGADRVAGQATLSGSAALAGSYPIVEGTKLSEVLKAPGALPDSPYTLFGIIARKDTRTLLRTLQAFTPVAILNGTEDLGLQSDDIIKVLSVNEVRLLTETLRLYRQRQDAQQAAVRNPLSQTVAPQNVVVPTSVVPGTTVPNALAAASQRPVTPGEPAPALSLADTQRRDIAELANQVDPVTRQTLAAQAEAQQSQIAQDLYACQLANPLTPSVCIAPATTAPPQAGSSNSVNAADQSNQLGQLLSSVQGIKPNESQGNLPAPSNTEASLPRMAVQPPAPNFQTIDPVTGRVGSNREIANFGDLARQLNIDQLVLVNFLLDHQAVLNGAVSGPGYYFVGPNVPLQDLVAAAGGTTNWADESGVELITTAVDGPAGRSETRRIQLPLRQGMLASYIVRPKDQLRFNQVFTDTGLGTATVQGEVRYTGTYQIVRGEHLSSLLARAGGLTGTAYPYGTIFLRKSAAATERDGYIRAAAEIEEELVVAMTRIGNDKIDPSTFGSLQGFVAELRNQRAIGRIAISADPSILASRPELDPLLEPGDVVYIPQRPSTISVLGQVMQPGSLPYRSNLTLKDYVQMAGGYSPTSAPSNVFIVLPDGSARKVETSWLGFGNAPALPPGSAIVVPRDVTPINTRQLILDITSIMSSLVVTVASLAVISR